MSSAEARQPPYRWEFDHINLRAGDSPALQQLFGGILGLQPGYRPPFPFPGDWFYRDGEAWLHLVRSAGPGDAVQFGHIAFRTDEPASHLLQRVRASGLSHDLRKIPQENSAQIFVRLPGGLVVELAAPLDAAALDCTPRYEKPGTIPKPGAPDPESPITNPGPTA